MAAFGDASTYVKPRETFMKDGKVIAYAVLAGKKIMKGDIVRIPAAGYAIAGDGSASLAQYDCCAGIALETVDNTLGGSGAVYVCCLVEGIVPIAEASVNIADVGCRALQAAGNAYTITSAATTLCTTSGADDANNEVHVGLAVGIDRDDVPLIGGAASTTKLLVKLQTLRQAYQ